MPPTKAQVDQFAAVIQTFMSLRSRLTVVLPEDLARLKAQLRQAYPGGTAITRADHNLLYNIGAILAHQEEPISMGDLSRQLDVPLSSATRIVDWLVTNRYVERIPDPVDRRIVRVRFTESGQTAYRITNEFIRTRVARLLSGFTREESATLINLLRKLARALESEVR